MSNPASTIALVFVKKGIEEGNPITQMKLQKLLYFAQGVHLARTQKPIINESFQAWKFGPVVPQVYQAYKFYQNKPITNTDLLFLFNNEPDLNALDASTKEAIQTTWDALKDVNPIKLSNWTHKKGSPWSKHYVDGISDIVIPNKDIEQYFIETFINKTDGDANKA